MEKNDNDDLQFYFVLLFQQFLIKFLQFDYNVEDMLYYIKYWSKLNKEEYFSIKLVKTLQEIYLFHDLFFQVVGALESKLNH